MKSPRKFLAIHFSAISCFIVLFIGCSKNNGDRNDVWGTVTWKGQPIPRGFVIFSPDAQKGNKGVQGSAAIKDGKFDTRFDASKGASKGPQVVMINALDGKNVNKLAPDGHPVFADSPKLSVEIPPGGGEINLVVPDTTPGASSSPKAE